MSNIQKMFTPSDIHVSVPLTQFAINYAQSTAGFVASKVFPGVNVTKQSDLYYIWDRAGSNRDEFQLRAPATESAGVTKVLSSDTYYARKWALHYDVADEERANADPVFNLDQLATGDLMFKGLLRKEKIFASTFMTTGVWATDITGVAASPGTGNVLQWNDANSTPIEDIRAAASYVQSKTGFRPNTLVMGQQVKDKVVNHVDIIDRIKYGASADKPAIVTDAALAALFEVDNVFVMSAVENTAKEGLTESSSFIGGKTALLTYSAPTPSTMLPSAGYTLNWTTYLGNSPNGIRITDFRMEHLKSDRIEAEMFFDMKKTGADLGYFFTAVVA